MKKNIIKKFILIMIAMIFLTCINVTEVFAATYRIKNETTIYSVNKETGEKVNSIDGIAADQTFEAGETRKSFVEYGAAINCIIINSNRLKRTDGGTTSTSSSTMEYYIPINDIEEVSDVDLPQGSGGSSSGGYGTTGAYGSGTVTIDFDEEAGRGGGGLADMTQESTLDEYKSTGVTGASTLSARSNIIAGIIQAVGTVIAVIMLTVIGIKYMISSVEERADYKQTMIPFVIGAGSLLIISNLVGIIYSLIENINV